MNSYEIDAIKIEKAKAMHRYRTFRKVATMFRTLEVFVVVILVSWSIFRSSVYLPAAVEVSGVFLRRVCSLMFCPHFVFLVGNAIIITLFANSRKKASSAESTSSEKSVGGDVFSCELQVEEREPEIVQVVPAPPAFTAVFAVVENREPEVIKPVMEEIREQETKTYRRSQSAVKEVINPVEKEIREQETKTYWRSQSAVEQVINPAEKEIREQETKTYWRSQSAVEKVIGEEGKEKIELRRSKTVPRRKSRNGESAMAEAARRWRTFDVDDLSNEEFRRRVEAFIEKQQRFLREESKSLVLTNQ